MSDPNVHSIGEESDHSQEAMDNKFNNDKLKKQTKKNGGFRKCIKSRMKKLFSRRGSYPQDKSVVSRPTSLCYRYPESRTGLRQGGTAMSMPTLNDVHRSNSAIPVDELYEGTSATSFSANGEQSHSDPLDLFEETFTNIDTSLSDLCEQFGNYSFHNKLSDCVTEKHDCLDSEFGKTSAKCFGAVDERIYDNTLFKPDSTVVGQYGGEAEYKVKAPNNDDKQDEDATPSSQEEHSPEFSKMSTGRPDEQKMDAMSKASISVDDHGSESDNDNNRSRQECNMENSQAKESMLCLPTGSASETIEKIPIAKTSLTTDDIHLTDRVYKQLVMVSSMHSDIDDRFNSEDVIDKAENDHINIDDDIITEGWTANRDVETLLGVSGNVINPTGECHDLYPAGQSSILFDDRTGNHVPTSSYFKEQELHERANGPKAIGLDEKPNQDDNFEHFFQSGNQENLQNKSREFSEQDQARHADRNNNSSSDPITVKAQLLKPSMGWIGKREVGQHGNDDDVADEPQRHTRKDDVKRIVGGKSQKQHGIDGGLKSQWSIAVPMRLVPDSKFNQPTSSPLKKGSYQPKMDQTSTSLVSVKESFLLQESIDNMAASNTSLDDSQDSNFAMKSGTTYQERPEIETKRALPMLRTPILSAPVEKSGPINKPQSIQGDPFSRSAEMFTSLEMNLMSDSQEHYQVHDTPINLIKPEKKQHAGGARRKQTIHALPTEKPATQGRHLNATDAQLGISFTPGQNMSNKTDSRKEPMTSNMPPNFNFNMVADTSANQKSDRKNSDFPIEMSQSRLSQMDLLPLPPSSLNLGSHLRASVDESKASPGMDDSDQDNGNLAIYIGTNNGDELLNPLNDRLHYGVDEAASITHTIPSIASLCEDEQQPSHHEFNTTTLPQPTSSSDAKLNQKPTLEFADAELPLDFQSNALLTTEAPPIACIYEFLQTPHTESMADYGVGDTEYCTNVPESSPSDLEVIVNSRNFPQSKALTQQDEAINEISSPDSLNSFFPGVSLMDCNEMSIMSTSLGMSSHEEMPSTSSYHITLDASHDDFCEPDHRSKRESIIPDNRRLSQRCFTTDQLISTSQNAESALFVEDEERIGRETLVPVSSEHSSLPQAEFDAIPFDVNFDPGNVLTNTNTFANRFEDGLVPLSGDVTREIELEHVITPRCCAQCKGSVDLLFEENLRQICEDCKRSNKREANQPNTNSRTYGICFSCGTCATSRNWKQCMWCSRNFCRRSCHTRHAIHCQPKTFDEFLEPED